MLNYSSKTAIKAVVYLASKSGLGQKVGIKETAEQINANSHTVGKILQTLVRQGIINSTKGPSGGFFIDQDQLNQSIGTIVEAIQGKQVFTACGLGLSECSTSRPCPIHNEYKLGRDMIVKLFREKRVKDLCHPLVDGLAYLS